MASATFGILPHPHAITFPGGSIEPLATYSKTLATVAEATNPDGFLYPPLQRTIRESLSATAPIEEVVPRSTRPALLRYLPATHKVTVPVPVENDFKRGDAGFLVNLAAYLFGTRVQFQEWQIDGRIPISRPTHAISVTPARASAFFALSYETWRSWQPPVRRAFTTALYMHSKAPVYEWLWEQFLVEYVTFDAFWRLLDLPKGPHAKRIRQVCTHLGLWFDDAVATAIVDLRNDLFHEALWEGDAPGFAVTHHGWDCTCRLRALNQRIIPAILAVPLAYRQSSWSDTTVTRFFE